MDVAELQYILLTWQGLYGPHPEILLWQMKSDAKGDLPGIATWTLVMPCSRRANASS